jgi:membrane fusion protein, multidrug efflux system
VRRAAWRGVGFALAAIVVASGCDRSAPEPAPPPEIRVLVVKPQRGTITQSIELPGDLVGFYEAALHAKVTGYLKSIGVDKGDHIKAGQVLAEIEVPELHSNLDRARARMEIQRITYERLKQVQHSDSRLVSQQDVDMAIANYQEAAAEVRTLETMVGYTKIIAPFDGIVTGRFADPGALIRAGGGEAGEGEASAPNSPAIEGAEGHRTDGGPLLTVAKIDKLRVYVYVPEAACPAIRRGTPAILHFDELPHRQFTGAVTRYANALDLATRTMLTEIDIDNPGGALYPRMYAHVTLELARHPEALRVPVGAIHESGEGAEVLVVSHGRLGRVPVATGIDNGSNVEITSGLKGGELVVASYNNSLSDGESVNYVIANGDAEAGSVASSD